MDKETLCAWLRFRLYTVWRWLDINPYEFENPKWMNVARAVILWFALTSVLLGLAFWCLLIKMLALKIWHAIF
jgi:hypothetical protein